MQVRRWLIVRADGDMRVVQRFPSGKLRHDEVAFKIVVEMPDAWGRIQHTELHVDMPEPPTVEMTDDVVLPEVTLT